MAELSAMRGDYNRFSKAQLQILDLAGPFIEQAVEAHSASLAQQPLICCDFGSSTGANSSAAAALIIDTLRRKYGEERTKSILYVHEDVARNDWTQMFTYLQTDPRSYLKIHKGVTALASGTSFYEQNLPNNSLHFGFCCASVHWTSGIACKMENHILPSLGSPDEQEAWRQLAARDWENFLTARSAELVPGAVMIVNVIADDKGYLKRGFEAIYRSARRLREIGRITGKELLDFNIRFIFRSIEDVTDPEMLARLGLEVISAKECDIRHNAFYENYRQHRDVSKFVADYVTLAVPTCEPSFVASLDASRTVEEKQLLCGELWSGMKDELFALGAPEAFAYAWANIFVVYRKCRDSDE